MASKCPKCGAPLRWWNFRAECKKCGVNIPNYNWEARLEEDSENAEVAFAKLHYKLANFKSGTVGSFPRILRLVFTLLPLAALVVPLVKLSLVFPFYEKSESVSFLTLILNYITKLDFFGGFSLMSATAIGPAVKLLMFSILAAFIAVAAGVLNFFVVLIAAINLRAGLNVLLNIIATVGWCASAVLFSMFAATATQSTVDVVSGSVVWWGYAVGIALFAINVIINILTVRSFKKQKKSQPTIQEAVEKEIAELHAEAAK